MWQQPASMRKQSVDATRDRVRITYSSVVPTAGGMNLWVPKLVCPRTNMRCPYSAGLVPKNRLWYTAYIGLS